MFKKQFAKKNQRRVSPPTASRKLFSQVHTVVGAFYPSLRRRTDGRTDGRTCTRKREDDAAGWLPRSLPHFALEPPPAFTFFRLGFRFPKSFSYSSAVDEEGVVVEFWRSTTSSRGRRERNGEASF